MNWLWYALIAFLIFDFVVVVLIAIRRWRKKVMGQPQLEYIKSHWMRIIDSFDHDPKHAILDADKLLDYALKQYEYQGSVGEKMKKAKSRFSDNNGIWRAHKLRNRIAHELGEIDRSEAKRALKNFKKALNDLGAKL